MNKFFASKFKWSRGTIRGKDRSVSRKRELGATAIEYALMVGLISVGIIGAAGALRDKSISTLSGAGSAINPENVAPTGIASASSLYSASYPASNGIDGTASLFHSGGGDLAPYWELVLPEAKNVQRIHISTAYNAARLSQSWVMISPNPITGTITSPVSSGLIKVRLPIFWGYTPAEIDVAITGKAKYIRIWQDGTGDPVTPNDPYVHFNEFQVFA